jgi:hypothetical protein
MPDTAAVPPPAAAGEKYAIAMVCDFFFPRLGGATVPARWHDVVDDAAHGEREGESARLADDERDQGPAEQLRLGA